MPVDQGMNHRRCTELPARKNTQPRPTFALSSTPRLPILNIDNPQSGHARC